MNTEANSVDISPDHDRQRKPAARSASTLYVLALLAAVTTWFLGLHQPFDLDETSSVWFISGGPRHIWSNRLFDLVFPVYYYLLWFWSRFFGTSEAALRSLSVLAMLAAAWVLYLAAEQLFNRRALAFAAVIVFCVHPITIFESVNVRPYPFVALAASLSIWLLLRLRNSNSLYLAALFGLSAALTAWFHYLSVTILPGLLICYFLIKRSEKNVDRRTMWRQLAVALAFFVIASLPLVPGILYLLRTAHSHVYESTPSLYDLFWTVAPRWLPILIVSLALAALVVAALSKNGDRPSSEIPPSLSPLRQILIATLLGPLPILLLFAVSAGTSIHCFVPRHRMVAIPGIALCWAWLISRFRPPVLHLLFCVALAALTFALYITKPLLLKHDYSWKYALQKVEAQAAPTHSPALICSDFIEASYEPLPSGPANDSRFLAQLSYYRLSVPAYVLPSFFNARAAQIGSAFLQQAAEKHQQFFALAFKPAYPTLDWLSAQAAPDFVVTDLGIYDSVKVLKFTPQPVASAPDRALSSPSTKGKSQPLPHQ